MKGGRWWYTAVNGGKRQLNMIEYDRYVRMTYELMGIYSVHSTHAYRTVTQKDEDFVGVVASD